MPEPINELFADLDKRLEFLSHYSIDVTSDDNDEVSISHISKNLWQYEDNGALKLKATLREIENLLDKKESLVDKIYFTVGSNPFQDPYENKPKEKRAAQLKAYPALKKELITYKKTLTQAAKNNLIKLSSEPEQVINNGEEIVSNKTFTFVLPDLNLPKLKRTNPQIGSTSLNKEQTALLFHYLMDEDHKLFYKFDDTSISKFVSLLTGHSDQTLRQDGFGKINTIKHKIPGKKIKNNPNPSNLQVVKKALQRIIDNIDKDIAAANKTK